MFCILILWRALTPVIQGGSRMRESRPYGFVRGVSGDLHPYRDTQRFSNFRSLVHASHIRSLPRSESRLALPSPRNPRTHVQHYHIRQQQVNGSAMPSGDSQRIRTSRGPFLNSFARTLTRHTR